VVVISYNSDLAIKHQHDFRAIIASPFYQRLFPLIRISRNTEFETVTEQYGYRRATSIDGTLTGIGGDILIIDDYLKPGDALSDSRRITANNLFFNTILSRLDNKRTGAIIVVGQRLHVDDLSGMLLRSSDQWTSLSLPAISEQEQLIPISDTRCHPRPINDLLHPELLPLDFLQSLRNSSPETFAAQYQQNPLPPGGAMIKRDWILDYDQLPEQTSSSGFLQSIDTASKSGEANARSACTIWLFHENKYYLVDVLVGQFDYLTLKERTISRARAYNPTAILIEDTGIGTALIAELKKAGLPSVGVKPTQDKKSRLSIQISKFANGQVFFPTQKPWRAEVESELLAFPNGRYDDIVDSISQALAYEPTTFDFERYATGMERLYSGLAFQRLFMGRAV
jgi:predicted phage terminase large subunit-like protein